MQALETNDTLYKILSGNEGLKAEISGGIYAEERPDNSEKEDIVINCLYVSHDRPQIAINNINVHVPDMKLTIQGVEQFKADRSRLRTITEKVLNVLEEEKASIEGAIIEVTSENILTDIGTQAPGHYTNIRINFLIC